MSRMIHENNTNFNTCETIVDGHPYQMRRVPDAAASREADRLDQMTWRNASAQCGGKQKSSGREWSDWRESDPRPQH